MRIAVILLAGLSLMKALGACTVLGLDEEEPEFVEAPAESGNALAGQDLANRLCAGCHALLPGQESPNPAAPNFNTLELTYPVGHLAESFAEGIVVGTEAHVQMPEFRLEPQEIEDLIAYLELVVPPPVTDPEAGGDAS